MKVSITVYAPNESEVWGQSWGTGLACKIANAIKAIEMAVAALPDDCEIEVHSIPQRKPVHFDDIDGVAY